MCIAIMKRPFEYLSNSHKAYLDEVITVTQVISPPLKILRKIDLTVKFNVISRIRVRILLYLWQFETERQTFLCKSYSYFGIRILYILTSDESEIPGRGKK